MVYVVVKCCPLDDQCECDANRIPICAVSELRELAFISSQLVEECFFEVWELDSFVEEVSDRHPLDRLILTAKVFDIPDLALITEIKQDPFGYWYRESRLNTDRPEVLEFYEALHVM